jgi:hypothetical protein
LESYASAIRGLSEQHGIQAFVTGVHSHVRAFDHAAGSTL